MKMYYVMGTETVKKVEDIRAIIAKDMDDLTNKCNNLFIKWHIDPTIKQDDRELTHW